MNAGGVNFIVAVLIPGFLPIFPSAAGPVLWIIAVVLSTMDI